MLQSDITYSTTIELKISKDSDGLIKDQKCPSAFKFNF